MADTVFALATAPGRAAVAVMRLSGPEANRALTVLTGGRRPAPRVAGVRTLRLPDGPVLDEALVLWFPGPASYTGEDCAELHLHGGPAVVDGVTDAMLKLGLRPADPGEFTRRAFENGKLDLSQAEAVADLVDAVQTFPSPLVLVTPEVGLTVVPPTAAGRRFADELGALNQRLADHCERVAIVVAGQPLWVKPTAVRESC